MTMTLIETKTLASAAASIEFTSIPQDGTDLVVLVSARFDVAATNFNINFNGSSSNFTTRQLYGTGSSVASNSGSSSDYAYGTSNDSTYTSNTFSNAIFYIPNYTSSVAKSFSIDGVTENNATAALSTISAGIWNPATQAAITSITLTRPSANFVTGSSFSLYKITKGSDGTTVVS